MAGYPKLNFVYLRVSSNANNKYLTSLRLDLFMGVEWHIGCIKCKRQIWLGSQKPFKWKGFQIGDKIVKRFLSLHSKCGNNLDGNLLLANDGTELVPWESDDEKLEWKEDILSRSFCFHSWYQDKITCAECRKELNAEENCRVKEGNLMKNTFLWFCDEKCFVNYVESCMKERESFIYDSTVDHLPLIVGDLFEVGCTKCKTYVAIDNTTDSNNFTRNFEYLALFFEEHIGPEHILKVNIDNENIPWKQIDIDNDWKEYEY